MAHASSSDALKSHMKKIRKQRSKAKEKWNKLDDETKKKIIDAKNEPLSLKVKVQNAIYDISTNAKSLNDSSDLRSLFNERLKEIENNNENFVEKEVLKIKELLEKYENDRKEE